MVTEEYLIESELKRKEMKAEYKRANKVGIKRTKKQTPYQKAKANFKIELAKATTKAEKKRLHRQWAIVKNTIAK